MLSLNKKKNGKLILDKIEKDYKFSLNNSLHINKEIEVISESDAIKVYKNGVCFSTIKQSYGESLLYHKINDEAFAIMTKNSVNETYIEVYSLKKNEIIYSSRFLVFRYIFNFDTFVITSNNWIDTKIEGKQVIRVSPQSLNRPN